MSQKLGIFAAVTAATALMSTAAFAAAPAATPAADPAIEHCVALKDGKNIVADHKNDCKTPSHSCAGQAAAGSADSWINVPAGQCAKINMGDFSGIDAATKAKLAI